MKNCLTDVTGIKVGHCHNSRAQTGCTVILPEKGAVASVDIRGFSPGTRETALLDPLKSVQKIHAILLTGGSAFGLDAAAGVVQFLEENDIGYDTGLARIPLVPAAVIYDLATGSSTIRPDKKMGYTACQNARETDVSQGKIGVGCGATVGKITGMENSMPGGVGQASLQLDGGCIVSALVVVNALGDVFDAQNNAIIAGARNKSTGEFINTMAYLQANASKLKAMWAGNTTLAVVATNAKLTKVQAAKVAQMAHDGFARAINPVHTTFDGDTIFAMSCGDLDVDDMVIGAAAAEVVEQSILNGVRAANSPES
ncbi:MAG: peptidase S58 family protein [Calditrichaeota bacterium]|nr:MAG: peptidase S58 family protein [Calditrichota bacterium]